MTTAVKHPSAPGVTHRPRTGTVRRYTAVRRHAKAPPVDPVLAELDEAMARLDRGDFSQCVDMEIALTTPSPSA